MIALTTRVLVGSSLAEQLRRAFGLIVLLVVVVGGSGIIALSMATSRLDTLSTELAPAVESNSAALQLMLDAETGVRGYLLTRDTRFLAPYERAHAGVLDEIDRAEALADRADLEIDFSRERESAQVWLDRYAAPAVSFGPGPGTPSTIRGKRTFDQFREEHARVTEQLTDARQQVRDEARSIRAAATPALLVATLLFGVIAAVIARSGVRSVDRPLQQLRDVLDRLRRGEFSARAARESSRRVREELGRSAVLTAAARELGQALDVDRVWIRYVTDDESEASSRYPVQAQWHREGLSARDALGYPGAKSLAGIRRLWRAGEVFAVSDTRRDDRLRGTQGEHLPQLTGARGMLVVPVGGNDDVIAVALLVQETPRTFTTEVVRTAQWVCGDLGRALEHSRLFEQQLELVDRLQELDRQKTDFLSTISHELRTPLTSIAGYAELLRDGDAGPVTDQMTGMLEVIERNTVRLRALIEDLLMLSRIESGAYRGTVAHIDLAALVGSVARSLRPQADAAELQLDVHTGPHPVPVLGDEMQLERVVLNLLSNAVKFTPPGGRVLLGLEPAPEGDAVLLRVLDTGIGIPEGEQEQLFSRFFRASNAVERAVPGTGLGLSIVRGILEHHGGSLKLTSEPGKGTEVLVRLPLVRELQPAG
jgi:two-component system, OmpR family, phosphate regulon sensor histidine kinase PhoR